MKQYMLLVLSFFVVSYVCCMELQQSFNVNTHIETYDAQKYGTRDNGDVSPFSQEEVQAFDVVGWRDHILALIKEDKEGHDSLNALFEDPVCKRVILSDRKVQAEFCDNMVSEIFPKTLVLNCDCPFGRLWPAVRRMIGLTALVGFPTNFNGRGFCGYRQSVIDGRKLYALHQALWHNDIRLTELLLNRDIDPNKGDHSSAFIEARSVPMAKLLLRYGADYSNNRVTPFWLMQKACFATHAPDLLQFYLEQDVLKESFERINRIADGDAELTSEKFDTAPLCRLAAHACYHEPSTLQVKLQALLQAGAARNDAIKFKALEVLQNHQREGDHNQEAVTLAIKMIQNNK